MSVMGSLVRSGRTEVTDKLRREVERVVKGYVEQGVAEVVPGVVFIDEVGSYLEEMLLLTKRGRSTCLTSSVSLFSMGCSSRRWHLRWSLQQIAVKVLCVVLRISSVPTAFPLIYWIGEDIPTLSVRLTSSSWLDV
jgi:TIP49 P-loop domain